MLVAECGSEPLVGPRTGKDIVLWTTNVKTFQSGRLEKPHDIVESSDSEFSPSHIQDFQDFVANKTFHMDAKTFNSKSTSGYI
jgi:hypothetical protein